MWLILVLACTIHGPLESSRRGSVAMQIAWTIWSGFAGPRVSCVLPAGLVEGGAWATVDSCVLVAVAGHR